MVNSFFKRCVAFVALFLCFHMSLFAQCPSIEDVTFPVTDYFCSSEKPEMTVDLGSTQATSFYVYKDGDMENPIYEETVSATSSYTLQLENAAKNYVVESYPKFLNFYIVASDGVCKSEPKKVEIPYQSSNLGVGSSPVLFCEGGDNINDFVISLSDVDRDRKLIFYDEDNNILNPSSITHSDNSAWGNAGKYTYTLPVSNDPAKKYSWKIDISGNRCLTGSVYRGNIKRYMTAPHKLSLGVEVSPNTKKNADGYVVCENSNVTLTKSDENFFDFESKEISTGATVNCQSLICMWEYRKKGDSNFTIFARNDVPSNSFLVDDTYEFRLRSAGYCQFDGCPTVYSDIITVEPEANPEFTLETVPDCENQEVELSIVSNQKYDASQITATANGTPISFSASKATAAFTEDVDFEVSIAGEVCPAVTETATAEYKDCEKITFQFIGVR